MTAPVADPAAEAERIRQRFNDAVAAIGSNGDLTPDAITRRTAQAWVNADADMTALQQRATGNAQTRKTDLTRQLFGTVGVPGDAAALTMSARDAAERVAQIDPSDLWSAQALLDRAEVNGDEILARQVAAAAHAHPVGAWSTVLDTFLATRPAAASALAELNALEQQSLQSRVHSAWTFLLPKPDALRSLDEWRIRSLATEAAA